MKKQRMNYWKRLVSLTAAAALLLTSLSVYAGNAEPAGMEESEEKSVRETGALTNVASQFTVTADSEESEKGHYAANLIDGNTSTLWVTGDGAWPSHVAFDLPEGQKQAVKKVVIKLESGHSDWGMDVSLGCKVEGTEENPAIVEAATQTVNFDDGYTYTFDTAQELNGLYITLNNPTNAGEAGTFWAAMAEVEIYVEEPKEPETLELTNIAPDCTITTTGDDQNPPTNMVDGDLSTLWVHNGYASNGWPSTVGFELPADNTKAVKKVAVKFESGYPLRGVTVNLQYALNNVTSNLVTVADSEKTVKFDDGYSYEFAVPQGMSHLYITLKNPTNGDDVGTFWPAMAEVEIYVEEPGESETDPEPEPESSLENIAAGCIIAAPGTSQSDPSNMVDGNAGTMWVHSGSDWPITVEFKLPPANTKAVKKVAIKFESGHTPWGVDVNLQYALNNVTSNLVTVADSEKTVKFDDGYSYEFAVPQGMSHLYITLKNPTNGDDVGTFWPAMAEVEIYVDKNVEEVVELENIANTLNPSVTLTATGADRSKLTDGDMATGAAITETALGDGDAFAQFDFGMNQKVREFTLGIPAGEGNNTFRYTLEGKQLEQEEFTEITTGTITDSPEDCVKNIRLVDVLDKKEAEYASVRAVFTAANDAAKGDILVLNEFQVWANKATILQPDNGSIAWNKRNIHSNDTTDDLSKIVDGNTTNTWTATQYPAYVDIDLEALYDIFEIQVFTPSSGYSQYTLYVSDDGQNFDRVAKKTSTESSTAEGESYPLENVDGSIVRILMEYNSQSERAVLNEVRVLGTRKADAVYASFETPADFAGSEYDVAVTDNDTIEEVQGIITRNIGAEYVDWFTLTVGEQKAHDYFELEDGADGKIHITGNDGISLATGLNHYLKYFCNVNITQVGSQVTMPENMVPVGTKVYKECAVDVRYAYNYCTMSYSMPFWGENEWRKELDWLALNGVNLVLDITGQEEVWRQFLSALGYDHASIKDFIAGPAYYAWAYMANLSGYGGPVHDNWFTERTELARKNHLIMEKLGMQPVLQGYSGMVPTNVTDMASGDYALNESDIILQGTWCSFRRPDMLVTTSDAYEKYAALFYQCQANVFGTDAHYYATDPFHEGGNTGSLNTADVSENVVKKMLAFDPEAVWVIQAWQGNPTPNLMAGLNKAGGTDYRAHALVLDLYAEKSPWWNNSGYYPVTEFNDTPWVYCMLNNFGGRMGLHGHMDNLVSGVVEAANTADHLTGIGIAPEGSQNNPVLYDLLFETVWCDDASQPLTEIDTEEWLKDYAARRYGAESDNAYQAMLILENTVYKAEDNMLGQGAPESYINARPSTSIGAASTWGNAVISYDMEELEYAAELLLSDYDLLKDSDGYMYDLADILKQVLSNSSQKYHRQMVSALNEGDLTKFTAASDKFLDLIDKVEETLSTREEFLLGTWVEQAKALAVNADEFTKDLYEFNAKAIVTTWGAYPQAESGGLKDYSNRQWSGLTSDFYKVRWQKWIDNQKAALAGQTTTNINWFEMEWAWARDKKVYTTEAAEVDLKVLGRDILDNYNSEEGGEGSDTDDSYDYPVSKLTATSPNYQDADGNRPADVLDGDASTLWHTIWDSSERTNHHIVLEMEGTTEITGIRYLPRSSGSNGIITKYEVYVSTTGGDDSYRLAASGNWASDSSWKKVTFENPVTAKYVKLVSVESLSTEEGRYYSSAAELRITTPERGTTQAESIWILPVSLKLTSGERGTLNAKVKPSAADQTVIWTSSDESVATVDQDGNVTAVSEAGGTAVITATAVNNAEVKATAVVTVARAAEYEEQVTEAKKELDDLVDEDKELLPEGYTEASWKAYEDALARVNEVLADADADLEEISQAKAAYEAAKKGLVEANQDDAQEIANAKKELNSLVDGDKGLLSKDYTEASWKAYEEALAKVNEILADADADLEKISQARAAYDAAKKGLVEVNQDDEQEIANAKKELNSLVDGDKGLLSKDYTEASWKAYGDVLAKVKEILADANADLEKISQAKTAYEAAKKGLEKVTPEPTPEPKPVLVSKISLAAETKNLAAGKKVKLTVEVLPANAANKTVTYTSSNTKYAVVDSNGVVTALKAGAGKSVTITAVAADGSKVSKAVKIKIYKNAIKKIKITAAKKTVKAGKRLKLKATLTPSKKIYKTLKWTSSNTKYAVVTKTGVVKTKKAGKGKVVKITVQARDGSSRKANIKIRIVK